MAQVRGLLPANIDNVDKQVTALLDKNVRELQPIFTKLFRKQTTTRKFERVVSFAPFGDVPQKPEGEPYATDIIQQAFTKDVTPLEWGLQFAVTEAAEEDDAEDIIAKKSRWLVFAMRQVQDKQAALVFDNGFSTQTTADSVALFSTSHTLKRGGTAKNRPSSDADLSVTSLALIPLRVGAAGETGSAFGMLVLGSPDAQRFNSGMGTDFLSRIGELASAALSRLQSNRVH